MFFRLLAFPVMVALIVLLYLSWEVDSSYSMYILPLMLILVMGYIFKPQIEWWRAQKKPPKLDQGVLFLLKKHSSFYQSLSEEEQEKFRHRVALFMMAKEFHGKSIETVPEDIRGIIAINAVHLTFYQEDFLFDQFENIIIYPHPFPSPQYLDHWHASEIFIEDGAILFSAEHLMPSYLNPKKYFNIGLYEFAKILMISYPDLGYPSMEQHNWKNIEAITGWSEEYISAWVGLPDIDLLAVTIVAYLTFPQVFQQTKSSLYKQLNQVLKVSVVHQI